MSAEYLLDDLTEIIRSQEIAQAVVAEAARQGLDNLNAGAVQGALSAGKSHRIFLVSLGWADHDELVVLSNALATVLSKGQTPYFEQYRALGTPVIMHLIDPPSLAPVTASLRSRMELPIRLILALLAGIALAFFLEYVDDSVRGAQDVEAAEVEVLGAIPRSSTLPWVDRRQR